LANFGKCNFKLFSAELCDQNKYDHFNDNFIFPTLYPPTAQEMNIIYCKIGDNSSLGSQMSAFFLGLSKIALVIAPQILHPILANGPPS
jgi:hypothetical protein